MRKLRSVFSLAILAAIAVLISSCGNGGTPTVTTASTSISGLVTDAPASGARVRVFSMKTGAQVGSDLTTDTTGNYSFSVNLDDYDSDDVFYAVANGGTVNGADADFLKFKSIIGSNSTLQAAGADGSVSAAEVPDLAVSNVTTAKVMLVEKANSITVDAGQSLSGQVSTIMSKQREQETENLGLVLKIAGGIKALVDDPANAATLAGTALNETTDLLDYMDSKVTVTDGVADVDFANAGLETAGAALEDEILADANLSASAVGEADASISNSAIAGAWYGYHVGTWGPADKMNGPQLLDLTIAATGGSCTSSQVYITITEDNTTSSLETACGTLSGNILKFQFTPSDATSSEEIEVVGTIDGSVMNGSYSVKISSKAVAGGIFKIGKGDSSSFAGTYAFTGKHTLMFVSDSNTYEDKVGDSGSLQGSFTISGTTLQGSITEESSNGTDIMMGELDGPRVKGRISTAPGDSLGNTIFVVFLVNDSEVTGLYMEYEGQITEPTGDPVAAGKFVFSTVTKS